MQNSASGMSGEVFTRRSCHIEQRTRGTYYFDAFESRRSSYMGPQAQAPYPLPVLAYPLPHFGGQFIPMRVVISYNLYRFLARKLIFCSATIIPSGVLKGQLFTEHLLAP